MLTALPLLAAALPPTPLPIASEARRVIEVQLASPPRAGPRHDLSPEEIEAIAAAYLRSIGKPTAGARPASARPVAASGAQVHDWLP